MLSSDNKANVLYTRHLDGSVVHSNKELEKRKESYTEMKSWLINKYGRPAHVADLYLMKHSETAKACCQRRSPHGGGLPQGCIQQPGDVDKSGRRTWG